jgi:iron complex transport system permease protein
VAPSTAGTIESATLGLLVATTVFGAASVAAKMGVAVAFALAGTVGFLVLVERLRFADMIVVPLVGIMFGAVIGAATDFFAYRADLLQTLSAWTNADFSSTLRGRYELLYLVAVLGLVAYRYADRFTVAGMGRETSVNLGVDHRRTVVVGLAIVAVVSAVVVVVVGAIPFLGLVAPNLTTMVVGDNLRRVLPVTALSGALFLLVCDIVSRTIRYPYEVPVGTVVGVLGGTVFVALIARSRLGAAAA